MTIVNSVVSSTLSSAPFEHPAMDYAFLRQEGIRQLERMAGQMWTDFNTHDPGITILEQLCYALTDLAQRIDYPLPDLLTSDGQDAYASLYGPAEILTSHAVSVDDMRKLAIDVEGVKNAWIEQVAEQANPLFFHASENVLSLQGDAPGVEPIALRGLVRVLIQISDLLYTDGTEEQREEVRRQVIRRLHENRSLGEDFVEIVRLQPEEIGVQAGIEIEAVEDVSALLVDIFQQIAETISPPVRFYTLRQLLDAGKPVDEIYDGPRLEHGFIDSTELRQAQRRSALRTSDLIHAIMVTPGVRAVRTISLSKGTSQEAWSLNLDMTRAPRFSPDLSLIRLERKGLAVSVESERVRALYAQRLRQATSAYRVAQEERELQPPRGRDRNVGSYYSFQHQFPATYGLGALGLPASASPQRQAQARQLKAYLLFFDQLLANYFAQLAHVRELFSFTGATAQTYFSQPLADPQLGLEEIRRLPLPEHRIWLQQITEQPQTANGNSTTETGFRRRGRLLHHLLARFAEQFTDYSLLLYGVTPANGTSAAEKLVQDQQAFLQEYLQVSSARGSATNYLQPWSSSNRSGLEKRIERKLGLVAAEGERFSLVEHILLGPMTGDEGQAVPFLVAPAQKDPFSLQISFVFPKEPPRFADAGFKEFVERTVREETPAHLIPYVHWFDEETMLAFEQAYLAWMEQRRSYWSNQPGG